MGVAENLAAVEARIAAACAASGRDTSSVRLLPVTKTRPAADVRAALGSGYTRFAENLVQDGLAKAEELANTPATWALIGHLQSNKVRDALAFASEFQALDSLKLAQALDRRLEGQGRRLTVLIQVNSSGEDTKYGLAPADVPAFAAQLRPLANLDVTGLMTLALPSDDHSLVAACFERMRDVQDRLRDADGAGWDELSMGMSRDLEIAIAHGATTVRVGTAVFGAR